MANLKEEYTDLRDIKHNVEHLTIPAADKNSREQIIEELFHVLEKSSKRIPP